MMEIERADYRDAAQILAKQAGLEIKDYQTKQVNPEKREKEGAEKEKYKRMLRLAQEYFVQELQNNQYASEYLKQKRQL
jgi:DNA primase